MTSSYLGGHYNKHGLGGADGEHNEARNFKHKTRKRDKKKKTTMKEVSVLGKLHKKKKRKKKGEWEADKESFWDII